MENMVQSFRQEMTVCRNFIIKTRRGWLSETECMRKHTTGNVYVVADFTQKMCEMSPRQLADYVQNNSIAVL